RARFLAPCELCAQLLNRRMYEFEQGSDLFDLQAREGDAQIGRRGADETGRMPVQEVLAQLTGVYTFDLDKHEVHAVERVDLPARGKARIAGDAVHLFGARLEQRQLLLALVADGGERQRLLHQRLRQHRAVADGAADVRAGLGVEHVERGLRLIAV